MAPTFARILDTSTWPKMEPADMLRLAALMVDPRGRCNRKAMTVLTVTFLVLQLATAVIANAIGGDLGVALFWTVNTPIILLGVVAVVKRLHDIGISALWAPVAVLFWITIAFAATLALVLIVGAERMTLVVEEKGPLYWLVFSFVFVPSFGGLIWLHTAPGTAGSNRFGPPPGSNGFGPGHRRSQTRALPSEAVVAG